VRAVVVDHFQEPSSLRVAEAPEPVLRPGTLAVDVRAAGCNFFDILMVQGRYQVKPPFPFIPGAELAGVVTALGDGVRGFALGDRVLAGPGLAAFAERAVVAASGAHKLPPGLSFAAGAALPTIYPTSYAGLVYHARLAQGETLLVHAAAGGVGSAAVQIGRALGARVLATASGAEKLKIAREAGADVAIDYTREDWVARVLEETRGRGADVIYDSVGGDVFDKSLKCIAWNGRLLAIGFASGEIPSVKVNRILLKNIAVVGLHWGAYAKFEPERIPETYRALFDLIERGDVRPLIYREYPLADVAAALAALGSRKSWGKVILAP
jgi:NADPH2:quinone reductase